MLDRKIKIFFLQICLAVWAISYSLLKSQKSTKAAALVALVVMTTLVLANLGFGIRPKPNRLYTSENARRYKKNPSELILIHCDTTYKTQSAFGAKLEFIYLSQWSQKMGVLSLFISLLSGTLFFKIPFIFLCKSSVNSAVISLN